MPRRAKPKSEFWWATIANADCEPVEVTTLKGERVAYTIGCPDPFFLDRPDCLCVLVPIYAYRGDGISSDGPMHRPRTPNQEQWDRAQETIARKRLAAHSWRGPR